MNLFPAILLAGPPHSGKSVLGFLLSAELRRRKIAHYLLRAVPDGEGDWFLEGAQAGVLTLKYRSKRPYHARFLDDMQRRIDQRRLPLLVDVGGRPQGAAQEALLASCTHVVLLAADEAGLDAWRARLEALPLLHVAELRSTRTEAEQLSAAQPVLRGVIAGLERDAHLRSADFFTDPGAHPVAAQLADQVAGLCAYAPDDLRRRHIQDAPYPLLDLDELGVSLSRDFNGRWRPEDLPRLRQGVAAGQALAVYGRAPGWLAAAVACLAWPAPAAVFDIHQGWVTAPPVWAVQRRRGTGALTFSLASLPGAAVGDEILQIDLPASGVLEADDLRLPDLPGQGGLVISGKLPLWAFMSLGRCFAPRRAWTAVYDPRMQAGVVVHSRTPGVEIGEVRPVRAPVE